MNQRIPGLDGLRAVSIGLVLLVHLRTLPGLPHWGWLAALASQGQFGVEIFFVISGFLITWLLLLEESRQGKIDLRQFYVRRAYRILPPAFAYLAFVSVLILVNVSSAGWGDIISSACFFRNFSGEGHSDTGHFWSLAIEEQFYLTWPFLLVLFRRSLRVPLVLGLLIVSTVFRHEYYRLFPHATIGTFEFHYDGLLVGCLLALARETIVARHLNGRIMRSGWFAVAAVAAIVLCLSPMASHIPRRVVACLPGIEPMCVAMVINYLIQPRVTIPQRILDAPPIAWVGKLSYSLYLWQQPFCVAASSLACALPWNLCLGITGAMISYYCIEQPALRLRQRRPGKLTAPVRESLLVPAGT